MQDTIERSSENDVIRLKAAEYPHFCPSRGLSLSRASSPAELKIPRMRNLGGAEGASLGGEGGREKEKLREVERSLIPRL